MKNYIAEWGFRDLAVLLPSYWFLEMGIYSAQELGFLKSWQSFISFDTLTGGALASFKEGSQIFVDLSINSTCPW